MHGNRSRSGVEISANHVRAIPRHRASRQFLSNHEIAEQHRDVPALANSFRDGHRRRSRWWR
jgi:hypothetical protein